MTIKRSLKDIDRVMDLTASKEERRIRVHEFKENYFFIKGFANVSMISTEEGIIVIDTNVSHVHANNILKTIRDKTDAPIKYIIYTHGHLDHVNSTPIFMEQETKVIGHENVLDRFLKYKLLEDYHVRINSIQFQNKLGLNSFDFVKPDITFSKSYSFGLGGTDVHIIHGKGETDDHCFIHVPKDDIVFSGDFFIGSFPNIGNPLKVIRYEREWFETLEKIQALEPEYLVPGHGNILVGKQEIKAALQDVIDALRFVHEKVIESINEGLSLEETVKSIQLPKNLEDSPFIPQTYGCLEFAIKGIYRRYTGWFDGNPTNLDPCSQKEVASEIASLVNDPKIIVEKSRALIDEGKYQMAMHLLDIVIFAEDHSEAKSLKKMAIEKSAETNSNFIMRNIYKQLV